MRWLVAWWRQFFGHPETDPWHDDARIRAERKGQHDRIRQANRGTYYDQWNERVRHSWRTDAR